MNFETTFLVDFSQILRQIYIYLPQKMPQTQKTTSKAASNPKNCPKCHPKIGNKKVKFFAYSIENLIKINKFNNNKIIYYN